jgi:flagellar M-ring protein FliF
VDDATVLPAPAGAAAGNGLPQLEAPANNDRLQMARALAKDNPAAVANIVRSWVARDA